MKFFLWSCSSKFDLSRVQLPEVIEVEVILEVEGLMPASQVEVDLLKYDQVQRQSLWPYYYCYYRFQMRIQLEVASCLETMRLG